MTEAGHAVGVQSESAATRSRATVRFYVEGATAFSVEGDAPFSVEVLRRTPRARRITGRY